MTQTENIKAALGLMLEKMAGELDAADGLQAITFKVRLHPRTKIPADVFVTREDHIELPGRRAMG